jgi:hypothetical protein
VGLVTNRHPPALSAAGRCALPAAVALLVAGCASSPPAEWAGLREVTPEFLLARDALEPALAADERGRVAMTWVERGSAGMDYAVAPGHPEQSFLLYRMESTDPGVMMPELGRQLVDERAVALMRDWIAGMGPDGRSAQ